MQPFEQPRTFPSGCDAKVVSRDTGSGMCAKKTFKAPLRPILLKDSTRRPLLLWGAKVDRSDRPRIDDHNLSPRGQGLLKACAQQPSRRLSTESTRSCHSLGGAACLLLARRPPAPDGTDLRSPRLNGRRLVESSDTLSVRSPSKGHRPSTWNLRCRFRRDVRLRTRRVGTLSKPTRPARRRPSETERKHLLRPAGADERAAAPEHHAVGDRRSGIAWATAVERPQHLAGAGVECVHRPLAGREVAAEDDAIGGTHGRLGAIARSPYRVVDPSARIGRGPEHFAGPAIERRPAAGLCGGSVLERPLGGAAPATVGRWSAV